MIKVCGDNQYSLLAVNSSTYNIGVNQIVSPPAKMEINANIISSLSSCGDHTVAITNDGEAFGIGENAESNFITFKSFILTKFTQIHYKGPDHKKCKAVSAVCGHKYTLFLIKSRDSDNLKLCISSGKRTFDFSEFLNTTTSPVALFGGYFNSAAIDSQGSIIFIPEEFSGWPDELSEPAKLPFSERATCVSCLKEKVFALGESGRVFSSRIKKNDSLSFSVVEELSEIVHISGTYEHCLAVDANGRVFGYGKNKCGRIGTGDRGTVSKFTLISALSKFKIISAFAGNEHSLFLTLQGKVLACGSNFSGQLATGIQKQENDCFQVVETTIESGATFCIAGYNTSFIQLRVTHNQLRRETCQNFTSTWSIQT